MCSNLHIVKLRFVCAPDTVVNAVVVSHKPKALVGVVGDAAGQRRVEIDSFDQGLYSVRRKTVIWDMEHSQFPSIQWKRAQRYRSEQLERSAGSPCHQAAWALPQGSESWVRCQCGW